MEPIESPLLLRIHEEIHYRDVSRLWVAAQCDQATAVDFREFLFRGPEDGVNGQSWRGPGRGDVYGSETTATTATGAKISADTAAASAFEKLAFGKTAEPPPSF